jgi:hypothetical protein
VTAKTACSTINRGDCASNEERVIAPIESGARGKRRFEGGRYVGAHNFLYPDTLSGSCGTGTHEASHLAVCVGAYVGSVYEFGWSLATCSLSMTVRQLHLQQAQISIVFSGQGSRTLA